MLNVTNQVERYVYRGKIRLTQNRSPHALVSVDMNGPPEEVGRDVSKSAPTCISRYRGSCAQFNSYESTVVTAVKDKCEGQTHKILTESFMPNLKVSKPNKISSQIYVLNSDRPYNNLFFFKYSVVHIVSEAKTRITTPGW